jgi:hypothetical protein
VLYLCTLPKRKASIRGSAGLQRLKFCVLQRKRRQKLLNEAVRDDGLTHGVGLWAVRDSCLPSQSIAWKR